MGWATLRLPLTLVLIGRLFDNISSSCPFRKIPQRKRSGKPSGELSRNLRNLREKPRLDSDGKKNI